MMERPTQKQIEEFWKGCGVKPSYQDIRVEEPSYPSINLTNLFRWAVGMLFWTVGSTQWEQIMKNWIDVICLRDMLYDPDGQALALFWAIYPLIVK